MTSAYTYLSRYNLSLSFVCLYHFEFFDKRKETRIGHSQPEAATIKVSTALQVYFLPNLDHHTRAMSTTTIILSHLSKDDFVASGRTSEYQARTPLSFVDQLKLEILNLPGPTDNEEDYYLKNITHWSSLPFLSRVIIILLTEEVAASLYRYLNERLSGVEHVKLTLQKNLLQRSKSAELVNNAANENSLRVLRKFKNYHNGNTAGESGTGNDEGEQYAEPEPRRFDAYNDLLKLGIDLSTFNNEEQLDELKAPVLSTPLNRTKSLTKTLFKPDLRINTRASSHDAAPVPRSPTITLDEM